METFCTSGQCSLTRAMGCGAQVMFLPQSAVTPPGASLADQLSYGAARRWGNSDMRRALHQVGLSHLLQRVDGDWDAHKNWTGRRPFFLKLITLLLRCHQSKLIKNNRLQSIPF